jgi:hypothetical protein
MGYVETQLMLLSRENRKLRQALCHPLCKAGDSPVQEHLKHCPVAIALKDVVEPDHREYGKSKKLAQD